MKKLLLVTFVAMTVIMMGYILPAYGQSPQAKGYVYDANTEEPLAGAVVIVCINGVDTKYETVTNIDGYFTVNVPFDVSYQLRVSCEGYKQVIVPSNNLLIGSSENIIFMEEDSSSLID